MLLSKTVKVRWAPANRKHYESLGYIFTKKGDEFEVLVEHLSKGSNFKVDWECDHCHKPISGKYEVYNRIIKPDGKVYCNKCSLELFGNDKQRKTKLKNSISMGQWALDNNLFHHIDLEKNKAEGIDVFSISYKSAIEIWFKCLEKDYHDSYKRRCCNFVNGERNCPYCTGKLVHPLDSLGKLIIDKFDEEYLWKIWSDKNTISPFEILPYSMEKVWWNCPDGKHEPFLRNCSDSKKCDFRCNKCNVSLGEDKIENFLINYSIKYKIQYTYNDCKSIRTLPFDFYLPDYNILIEYDGEQHFKPRDFKGEGYNKALNNFIGIKVRDTIKNIYCKNNNIKLIRIPYWYLDDIETILINELNINIQKVI